MSIDLTSVLFTVAPKVSGVKAQRQKQIISAVGPIFMSTLAAWDITTKEQIICFIGQTMQEADGYCTTVEYGNGRPNYSGGSRFKGRGFIQLTHDYNYRAAGKALGLDLINHPELAEDPYNALLVSCWYWKTNNLNRFCTPSDVRRLGNAINRGNANYSGQPLGASERQLYTNRAKQALERTEKPADAFSPLQATRVAPPSDKLTSEAPSANKSTILGSAAAGIASAWIGLVSFFQNHILEISIGAGVLVGVGLIWYFLRKT